LLFDTSTSIDIFLPRLEGVQQIPSVGSLRLCWKPVHVNVSHVTLGVWRVLNITAGTDRSASRMTHAEHRQGASCSAAVLVRWERKGQMSSAFRLILSMVMLHRMVTWFVSVGRSRIGLDWEPCRRGGNCCRTQGEIVGTSRGAVFSLLCLR